MTNKARNSSFMNILFTERKICENKGVVATVPVLSVAPARELALRGAHG